MTGMNLAKGISKMESWRGQIISRLQLIERTPVFTMSEVGGRKGFYYRRDVN